MKKIALLTLLVFLFPGLAFCAASKEQQITLKIAAGLPTRQPILDVIHFFAENLEKASKGTIVAKVYDPGKLVPPFEVHDAVASGQINAGFTASIYLSGKIPAGTLFSTIPFGPGMTEYLGWMYVGNGKKLFQEMFDKNGYNLKVFPLLVKGFEAGGWFRKPINSIEDLKGLKLRWPGLGGKVLSKLGVSVSTIPGSETFPALEKGAIDGTEWGDPASDSAMGFWKVAPYYYFPGWHQSFTCVELIINKTTWDSMSETQQTLVELAVMAGNTHVVSRFEALQGKTLKEMVEKHGVKIMRYSPEILDTLEKTYLEVIAEETNKDAFFKKVWEDLNAFRAEYTLWRCHSDLIMPTVPCK